MKRILCNDILENLKGRLNEHRYAHTLGVAYTAASLAMCYGEDPERAFLAGVLHDMAKGIPEEEQFLLCSEYGIKLSSYECDSWQLVHAKLGAYLAEKQFHIDDKEVLNAIRWHTTGKPEMTTLEKIIFIADFIEPNRENITGIAEVRKSAFENLNKTVFLISKNVIEYLKRSGKEIDPRTIRTYEYYFEIS